LWQNAAQAVAKRSAGSETWRRQIHLTAFKCIAKFA